ncbi:MAG: prolipoprotein diacylglyceryl transferase [Oscillospiraceae bacterium]|nr:prolipoprotein diacylglyceryl transferase [Oscillospiraceae bacterium]
MIEINTDYKFISPYPVMIILSLTVGIIVMYILNRKDQIQKNVSGYLCMLAPMMSLFFGLLLTYITSGGQYFGLSSLGGLAGMYLACLIMALINPQKDTVRIMMKNCTLVLPLIYSISKIGCLLGGCCRGTAYHGPFCIHYAGSKTDSAVVFPVQPAETLVFLIIFILGIFLQKKHQHTVWMVFIFSALAKFLLDFLRESHTNQIISFTQILCLLLLLTGFLILYLNHQKLKKQA